MAENQEAKNEQIINTEAAKAKVDEVAGNVKEELIISLKK